MTSQLLTLAFCLIFMSSPMMAQRLSSLGNEKLEIATSYVQELGENFGQHERVLVEPLVDLAGLYTGTGRYIEASRTLDRAIQILRRDSGLYTRDQIPYVQKKIENFATALDWENARQQMEHVNWLYLKKSEIADPLLVEDLLHLSDMHIRGINEDFKFYQSYHFRHAMRLNWSALRAAELIYGEEDERLIPVMYNLIKQYHLQQVAVERGGSLSYQLRAYFPGSDWVRERSEIKNYFYFMGRRLLNQIVSIYSKSELLHAEGLAMAILYTADWQVLFGRDDEALNTYFEAYDQLENLYPNRVHLLFEQPKLLPLEKFYGSMESAMTAGEKAEESFLNTISTRSISFVEWGQGFPHARQPYDIAKSITLEGTEALFSFNLVGVPDIERWMDTRRAQNFDRAIDARIVELIGGSAKQREILERRVQRLRFRPKLIEGLPQDIEVLLEYKMAPGL